MLTIAYIILAISFSGLLGATIPNVPIKDVSIKQWIWMGIMALATGVWTVLAIMGVH